MTAPATVLNVEDNAAARFLRSRILERAGFAVDEADTAAKAVQRSAAAALVLLDVNLPDGDGLTVCREIKRRHPGMPVVMVTSVYRTGHARRDAFAAGADAYLLEPVEAERLVRTVSGFLEGRLKVGAAAPHEASIWIVTTVAGEIEDLSHGAEELLNVTRRGAIGRSLPAYFAEDRPRLLADALRASDGLVIERGGLLRPRDRRPVAVHVELRALAAAVEEPGHAPRIRWTLTPIERPPKS